MRIADRSRLIFILSSVLLVGLISGCSPSEKKPDPDAAKKELEEMKKNLKKEWGY